jgi:hypothetical protein
VALEYTIPENGRTICLIVHQTMHVPNLSHNLLSTMHMRLNYVVVNETPEFQCEVPNDISHTAKVRGQNGEVLTIHMFINGVPSCITT